MARRTMTIKRIDPWSVLKVGFLANLVLLGMLLLAGRVVWFFIERLELIDRACEVASSVGFQDCGLNGGNIFRNALLLGLLGVVVQTGILVFGSFLHNLIAELTGGLTLTVVDDGPGVAGGSAVPTSRSAGRSGRPAAKPAAAQAQRPAATGAAAAGAASSPRPAATPGSGPTQPRPAAPGTPPSGATPPAAPRPGQPSPRPAAPGAPSSSGSPSGSSPAGDDATREARFDRDLFNRGQE